MVELLHVRFSFLCRSWRVNNKAQSPIVLRIVYRHERRDVYTGLYCISKEWNNDVGKVDFQSKQASTINKNLEVINYQAMQVLDQLKFSGTPFTIDELVARLKGKEERPTLMSEYLNGRCKELRKKSGIDISPATFEKYERSCRFVILFLEKEFKVKNYALVKVDSRFLEEYFQYLRSVRKIGNNTAVKYMTFLRTLLMPAIQASVIRQNPFRGLKLRIKTVPKGGTITFFNSEIPYKVQFFY